jgi:hypothetical protein
MATYSELLKDPRWQRKRLETLNAANWTCRLCGTAEKTLHVHHKRYRRGAMPWEYVSSELEVLCETCHDAVTATTRELKEVIESGDIHVLFRVSAYAQAMAAKFDWKTPRSVRVYAEGQIYGIADAFREASTYGLEIGREGVEQRMADWTVDLVSLAKEEDAAMEVEIQKSTAAWRKSRGQ